MALTFEPERIVYDSEEELLRFFATEDVLLIRETSRHAPTAGWFQPYGGPSERQIAPSNSWSRFFGPHVLYLLRQISYCYRRGAVRNASAMAS
jgi:hypothetical protein